MTRWLGMLALLLSFDESKQASMLLHELADMQRNEALEIAQDNV